MSSEALHVISFKNAHMRNRNGSHAQFLTMDIRESERRFSVLGKKLEDIWGRMGLETTDCNLPPVPVLNVEEVFNDGEWELIESREEKFTDKFISIMSPGQSPYLHVDEILISLCGFRCMGIYAITGSFLLRGPCLSNNPELTPGFRLRPVSLMPGSLLNVSTPSLEIFRDAERHGNVLGKGAFRNDRVSSLFDFVITTSPEKKLIDEYVLEDSDLCLLLADITGASVR